MYWKLLWIKASAKCINVNVVPLEDIWIQDVPLHSLLSGFITWILTWLLVPGSCLFQPAIDAIWIIIEPDTSALSLACLVCRSQWVIATQHRVNLWKRTSRVTYVTHVLWVGNETLHPLPSSSRCWQVAFFGREIWGAYGAFASIRMAMWERRGRHQPINCRDSIRASDNRNTQKGVPNVS